MAHKDEIRLLKALADETRFNILVILLNGEMCVCEIYPRVKRTQSTVSFQLGKLEDLGILESERVGKRVFYRIKNTQVCDIFKALGYRSGAILKKKCCMI